MAPICRSGMHPDFLDRPAATEDDASPECGWRALQQYVRRMPAAERPAAQKELDAVSSRLSDLYDDCLHGMDAELGRFLGGLRDAGMLDEYLGRDHGRPWRAFRRARPLRPWLEPVQRDDSRAADSHSAARRRTPGSGTSRSAARPSHLACPYPSATCPTRSPSLLDPAAANPFPGRSSGALLERPGARATPIRSSRSSKTRSLRGESFRTENVIKVDSLIDDDHILIENVNQPSELYDLFKDPRQERNLATPTRGPGPAGPDESGSRQVLSEPDRMHRD